MDSIIVNKVADSGIITLNLEQYIPAADSMATFDLKPFLFKEMIVREKDFRQFVTEHDWQQYAGKNVAVVCSADAIIPMWAYMLVASSLHPFANNVYFGMEEAMMRHLMIKAIEAIDEEAYNDKRVVIKGCGDQSLPEAAFIAITQKLRPVVKSLMYGEPCSTVPVFKRK
jgi:hypothetical protein